MLIEYTVSFSSDLRKRIAKAESETERHPTPAQIKAENYKKGKVNIDGLRISIENPKGSVRKGIDKGGKPWKIKMHNTYGYINGVKSVDGDDIDIFLSKDPSKGNVYIVDQVKPKTGKFDEHKIMYGYKTKAEAVKDYKSNYEKGWKGLGQVTGVSKPSFLQFIKGKTIVNKPAAKYKELKEAELKFSKSNGYVILYHNTATKNVPKILKEGLIPDYVGKSNTLTGRLDPDEYKLGLVYLTFDKDVADTIGKCRSREGYSKSNTTLKIVIPKLIYDKMDKCKDPLITWKNLREFTEQTIKNSKDAAEYAKEIGFDKFMEECRSEYEAFESTICIKGRIDPKYIKKL